MISKSAWHLFSVDELFRNLSFSFFKHFFVLQTYMHVTCGLSGSLT